MSLNLEQVPAPASDETRKGLLSDAELEAAKLGRFGHHPDSAIDFCIQVETLEARLSNAKGRLSKPGTEPEPVGAVLRDIERTMDFRVGGDELAVHAKHILRKLEHEAREAARAAAPASDAERLREAISKALTSTTYPVSADTIDVLVSAITHPPLREQEVLAVPVKALEWNEPTVSSNGCWTANTMLGTYSAANDPAWYVVRDETPRDFYFEWQSEDMRDTLDDAKAAAQADFDQRIRACLSHPAPVSAEDIAVLLEETGSRDREDLIDMARVGHSLLNEIASLNRCPGPFKDWAPLKDPAEIVTDLFNALHDAKTELAALRPAVAEPVKEAGVNALPQDVIDLVIAARGVAYIDPDVAELLVLDKAVEKFASRVPWDDEPEALVAVSQPPASEEA